jgi:hypothetical protein
MRVEVLLVWLATFVVLLASSAAAQRRCRAWRLWRPFAMRIGGAMTSRGGIVRGDQNEDILIESGALLERAPGPSPPPEPVASGAI